MLGGNAVFGLLVCLGVLFAGWGLLSRNSSPTGEPIDLPRAAPHWLALAEAVIPRVMEGSRFETNWAINPTTAEKSRFNLYLVDLSRTGRTANSARYFGNCAFTGRLNIVVCDVNLFERFLERLSFHKAPVVPPGDRPNGTILQEIDATEEARNTARQQMMTWVIGHELGHIEARDGGAHFSLDAFFRTSADAQVSQRRESAADGFIVKRLGDPSGRDKAFYDFLITTANREIRLRSCPDRSVLQDCPNLQYGVGLIAPAPGVSIRVRTSGSHPEYIVRLLNVMNAAGKHRGLEHLDYLAKQIADLYLTGE